jgi:CheY-like chemotaxis protein
MKKIQLVLLIDDNSADNDFHEIIIGMSQIAANTMSITSSHYALEYLTKCIQQEDNTAYRLPELVFLDINMSGLDGFQLLDRINAVSDPFNRKKQMKIFMLTGSLNPDDKEKAMEKYKELVSGFYIKPITVDLLKELKKQYF